MNKVGFSILLCNEFTSWKPFRTEPPATVRCPMGTTAPKKPAKALARSPKMVGGASAPHVSDGQTSAPPPVKTVPTIVSKVDYEKRLAQLQTELVRMQEWVVHEGLRVMV